MSPLTGTEIGPSSPGLVPFWSQVEELRTFWMSSAENLIFAFSFIYLLYGCTG